MMHRAELFSGGTNGPLTSLVTQDGCWRLADFPQEYAVSFPSPPQPSRIDTRPAETQSQTSPAAWVTDPATEAIVGLKPTAKGRARARLRMLRRLPANHDGEGAQLPDQHSFDAAIAFLDRLPSSLLMVPTVSSDGDAVIEFSKPNGLRADITFCDRGQRLACYWKEPGEPSLFAEGPLDQAEVRAVLRERFQAEI